MKITSLPRKVMRGLPYLKKEMEAIVSDHTPFFIAVPRVVHIWRGAPCNARCIMCDYGYLKGDAYKQLISSPFTDDMMIPALHQVAELCGRGTVVSYMGGEPTIVKGIVEWVQTASKLGLDFRFTTNGYKLDRAMAEKFVEAGLFNLGVSLEAIDPTINEIIRPHKDGTAKTINAIEMMIEERQRQKKYVSINIKTVLTDLNLEEFIKIVRRWGKIDGVMCTPQAFEPMEGMPKETFDKLYIKDVNRLERVVNEIRQLKSEGYTIHISDSALSEIVKLYKEDKNKTSTMHGNKMEMDPSEPMCNIATNNMWIANGQVMLCPYHPSLGPFQPNGKTLKQMWEDDQAKKVREGTRACRRLCTISCLRRTPLTHKVKTFLQIA